MTTKSFLPQKSKINTNPSNDQNAGYSDPVDILFQRVQASARSSLAPTPTDAVRASDRRWVRWGSGGASVDRSCLAPPPARGASAPAAAARAISRSIAPTGSKVTGPGRDWRASRRDTPRVRPIRVVQRRRTEPEPERPVLSQWSRVDQ
jgi:hypothetical protein